MEIAARINKIETNPYFINLNNAELSSFASNQESFIYAVEHWKTVLMKLVEILSPKDGELIMENVADESGNSKKGEKSHVETFDDFIMSISKKAIVYEHTPHVDLFNRELDELFLYDGREKTTYIASALGMIEYTYITVSKLIHDYVSTYIPSEEIAHYSVHEILDQKHSKDLFSLIQCDETSLKGIQKGYNIMYRLYESMSEDLR